MKFSVLGGKLKEALNIIEKIVAKSSTLPILNNVLLETQDSFLKLSATNLETGINFWLLAKIEKPGKIAVPAHVFSGFVNYLSSANPLTAEVKAGVLNLESNSVKTKINGFAAEDFPIIPKVEKSEKAEVKSLLVTKGLSQVAAIVSPSSIKPEISGVYHLFKKKELIMAATDSFRLGERKFYFSQGLELSQDHAVILPQRSASLLVSVFGDKEEDLSFYFSSNLLMCESLMEETDHPKIQVVSKLIEGEFPQYQEIIPKKYKTEAIIDKAEFLNKLKAASLFASRINEVKLDFKSDNQEIGIFCQNSELGEYSAVFPAEIKGEEASVSFNYRFLADGLAGIEGDKVWLALSFDREGEEGPAMIKSIGDKDYLYVVMPIQPA